MNQIKIILLIISITFISCTKEDQILAPDVPEPLKEKIVWDIISGEIAYKENDSLYLADKTTRTVKNLGKCYLFNLKWNKAGNEITGILQNNEEYSLEAYDLNGNHYELDEPSSFSNWYYDWLPDGRLAHITKLGYVYIENSKLIDKKFNARGMACSPDGKKIVVSNRDTVGNQIRQVRAQLIEIDIATGYQRVLKSGLTDIISSITFLDPVYSPDSKKVMFVINNYNPFGGNTRSLHITPNISLGLSGRNPDWSPVGERIIWSYSNDSIKNILIMTVSGDSSGIAIRNGSNPLWIK